jgi:hypothetical protein
MQGLFAALPVCLVKTNSEQRKLYSGDVFEHVHTGRTAGIGVPQPKVTKTE